MNLIVLLNLLNLLAGVLIAGGVYQIAGPGWACIVGGTYLAFNVITTTRALNVRDTTPEK